jgi:hypothetical protein
MAMINPYRVSMFLTFKIPSFAMVWPVIYQNRPSSFGEGYEASLV